MANSETGRAAGNFFGATPTDRLIDEREAAARLGLKVATLRRWRWAGKPPRFVKIGSAVRYEPAEIAATIAAGRRTSTSEADAAAAAESRDAT